MCPLFRENVSTKTYEEESINEMNRVQNIQLWCTPAFCDRSD